MKLFNMALLVAMTFVSQNLMANSGDLFLMEEPIFNEADMKDYNYKCDLSQEQDGERMNVTVWIDDDYNKEEDKPASLENMRVGIYQSFDEDEHGTYFDAKVKSLSLGRCAMICYNMDAKVVAGEMIQINIDLNLLFRGLNATEIQSGDYLDPYKLTLKVKLEGEDIELKGSCVDNK